MSDATTTRVNSVSSLKLERQSPIKTTKRRPLPDSKNVDGRPIWEPPVFCYDALIGEGYEQKRKAYLKYTNGDVVRTIEMMDEGV